jgi:hypothetical protein
MIMIVKRYKITLGAYIKTLLLFKSQINHRFFGYGIAHKLTEWIGREYQKFNKVDQN